MEKLSMPLVKVGSKHQVVIPKLVRTKLQVRPGDYVEVSFHKNRAVIKRKKVIDDFPVTDEPIGPKTKSAIRRGLKEVAQGKVVGPFRTADELVAHLNSLKKRR
jgi:AbrB family looped-hinge helix DNA binding protein